MNMTPFFSKTGTLSLQATLSRLNLCHSMAPWLLLLALFASFQTLAAVMPSPVAVDSQVKVTFSEFESESERHSRTVEVKAKLTNRSAEPILTPIRLVIKNIKPRTVTLLNATGLQPDGSPYVDIPLRDGVLSPREKVKDIELIFSTPKKGKISFDHSVLGTLPHINHPPVADAGADQTAFVGDVLSLDGSGSTDEDGDPITYRWRIAAQPAINTAVLDNPTAVKPQLTINSKGSYQLELIVNDGSADSTPATVLITTENAKPVAVAGSDQTVFIHQTATLDGILSHDLDNDPLTFHWQLSAKPATSSATLQNPDTQIAHLTPDKPGPYTVELVVNDGLIDSLADQIIIDSQNSKPVADAGPDQIDKTVGIPVELDGSHSSDVDGDALTYSWSLLHQPAGSSAAIQQADQIKAVFTPDKTGDYVGQLIVNDGQVNSEPATSLVPKT